MTSTESRTPCELKLIELYLAAKQRVIQSGYASEIHWQDQLRFSDVTESDFLREGAWVILSSGMRESIVRNKFRGVSEAFMNWKSASSIVSDKSRCHNEAMSVFAHKGKISAIVRLAETIYREGYQKICSNINSGGVSYLGTFDFIGPVTRYHLAKNIGLDVAKPDRHLVRVAKSFSYEDPNSLCQSISQATGDKVSVIDLVIWRFATIEPQYMDFFRPS